MISYVNQELFVFVKGKIYVGNLMFASAMQFPKTENFF